MGTTAKEARELREAVVHLRYAVEQLQNENAGGRFEIAAQALARTSHIPDLYTADRQHEAALSSDPSGGEGRACTRPRSQLLCFDANCPIHGADDHPEREDSEQKGAQASESSRAGSPVHGEGRCPTCGSDDPASCRLIRHPADPDVAPHPHGGEPTPCCVDPFHGRSQ